MKKRKALKEDLAKGKSTKKTFNSFDDLAEITMKEASINKGDYKSPSSEVSEKDLIRRRPRTPIETDLPSPEPKSVSFNGSLHKENHDEFNAKIEDAQSLPISIDSIDSEEKPLLHEHFKRKSHISGDESKFKKEWKPNEWRNKHSDQKTKVTFTPFKTVGTILFFDYNVNKFGFIKPHYIRDQLLIEKVFVSESSFVSKDRYGDGAPVIFVLNKDFKGYFATEVKSIYEISLEDLHSLYKYLTINDVSIIVEKLIPHDNVSFYYDQLENTQKEQIKDIILHLKDRRIWKVLTKVDTGELLESYINHIISPLEDNEKLEFLSSSFEDALLSHILSQWQTQNKADLLRFKTILSLNKIIKTKIPKSFIQLILKVEWTDQELRDWYSITKVPELLNMALRRYSFIDLDNIERLKSLLPVQKLDHNALKLIQSNLTQECDLISAEGILRIFDELSEYQIITNQGHLIDLLSNKKLNSFELRSILSMYDQSYDPSVLRSIISNNFENISNREIIDLLGSHNNDISIGCILLDEYTNIEHGRDPDYPNLIKVLRQSGNKTLCSYFLTENHLKLSIIYPSLIFDLALFYGHTDALKTSYQHLRFSSEVKLLEFIHKTTGVSIPDVVAQTNKPLSSLIAFINSKSKLTLTVELKKFLNNNSGIVQCLIVKFLIYQYYNKKLSKSELKEIFYSFQWTEISAILIIEFIQESDYTQKVLLDKLNKVYKTHFTLLQIQKFDPDSFRKNFSIHNILNKCNGRKQFDLRVWKGNGLTRLYVKGGFNYHISETHEMYCEGRPWKTEFLWDSYENKPSDRKFEFYWCCNKPCVGRNDKLDLNRPFNEWTIMEISEVLNISVEKIALATLGGWINRMNKIVDHLFCRSCGEVLRPQTFKPHILGYYAVPVFNCVNDGCPDLGKSIRFTHCLNSKCESHSTNEPLDSRDCKSCKPYEPKHTGMECRFCGQKCPACSGYSPVIVEEIW